MLVGGGEIISVSNTPVDIPPSWSQPCWQINPTESDKSRVPQWPQKNTHFEVKTHICIETHSEWRYAKHTLIRVRQSLDHSFVVWSMCCTWLSDPHPDTALSLCVCVRVSNLFASQNNNVTASVNAQWFGLETGLYSTPYSYHCSFTKYGWWFSIKHEWMWLRKQNQAHSDGRE